jgi:F0F1-type ATP synthase delta subunit
MLKAALKIAPPYDEAIVTKIKDTFTHLLGKELEFTVFEDASIIGGFVAVLGDRVYDASVLGQIQAISSFLKDDKAKTVKVNV